MGERGEIRFLAYARAEGQSVAHHQRKEVHLALIAPGDDALLAAGGLAVLRQSRILRLCRQAFEQGAILTYDDLGHLLSTSISTLKRDVRILERQGQVVPLYRQRGPRPGALLCLLVLTLLWPSRPVQAQLSSIFGSLGLNYNYRNRQSGDSTEASQALRRDNTLGVDGRILDPRLGTFSLSGSFGSSHLTEDNAQLYAFSGNLTLLQGLPYSLTLRHGQTFARNSIDVNTVRSGLGFRLALPRFPRFLLSLDRTAIDSGGINPTDQVFTNGSLRISDRIGRSTVEGEIGFQKFQDKIRDTSQTRYFARLSDSVILDLSQATTLRALAAVSIAGDQKIVSADLSLVNRPDPSLTRNVSFGYQFVQTETQSRHSMNASSSISKSFFPYPWLQVRPSAALSAAGNSGDGLTALLLSGSGSTVVSYFRAVYISADYSPGTTYDLKEGKLDDVRHNAHLGVVTRTLDPWRLAGDYFFTRETGTRDRTRHFIVAKADVALATNLSLRSFANYTHEKIRSEGSSSSDSGISRTRSSVNVGVNASYSPLFNLSLGLGGSFGYAESTTTQTIAQASTGLAYTFLLPARPVLSVQGLWVRTSQDEQTRYEINSRLSSQIGRLTLSLEYNLSRRERPEISDREHTVFLRLFRPFRRPL